MTEPSASGSDAEYSLTQEQQDALTLDQNVAITAGAGTGKTTTLTERYMHILESESGVGPVEIVTITFTTDASNELQDRIRDAVSDRLDAANPAEYDYWRGVKDELDDGYIHTIHGLCSRILREEIVDAPLTPEFEVYDETDATVLARNVVREFLDDQLDGGPREADVTRLAHLWTRSTLEDILVGLFEERPQSETWAERWVDATHEDYMDYVWDTVHPISPEFATDVFAREPVQDACSTIRHLADGDLLDAVPPGDDDGAESIQVITELLDDYEPLAADATPRHQQAFLDELCDYLTTNDGARDGRDWKYWGSSGRWEKAGRDAEQGQLQAAIETLFDEIEPQEQEFGVTVDQASSHYVLALARVFDAVLESYAETKQRQNVVDYNDLIETTIEFLEHSPEIRGRLTEQFDYVMVDEVQDTDPRQWELVQLLTSDDPDEFDATNVFLVGDEKQSIYRFRGADVTSFARARNTLADANPSGVTTNYELSGNFRTTDETLAFCNDLFDTDRLFAPFGPEYAPFETRPQALTPERKGGREVTGSIEYLLVPDDDYEELHAPGYLGETPEFVEPGEREAYALAARLTNLFADPPEVYDEAEDERRDAVPEDAAILLRSRGRLKAYERALDTYDIPYTVVSGTGYYDTPEITALLNLLRVLENPRDEIALYGVLRSPLFGFPDDTLATLRGSDDNLWAALGTATGEFEDAYQLLCKWRRMTGASPGKPPDDSPAKTPEETPGPSPASARGGSPEESSRVSPEDSPGASPGNPPGNAPGVSLENTTPWGAVLSKVIDDTGFMAAVAGDERPRQAAVNINRFREQLRRWEEGGVKTISELRSRLELRQDVEAHADEATIPEDTDGIELRTIHSAKGLEFPIVIVPELGTQFNFQADVDGNGKVYFDDIDLGDSGEHEPVLGIKSPTPEDAFAEEDTLVRRVTWDRIRLHDRAELKRLMYVALTRSRDLILLSGIHDLESGDGGYSLAEPNDPEDANCWRDWLQPHLLDDENLFDELQNTGAFRGFLPNSKFQVSRPPRPRPDWQQAKPRYSTSVTVDIPDPEPHQTERVLSATQYAALRAGPDREYEHEGRGVPGEFSGVSSGLDPTTLGTIIHRICETRLDRAEWRSFAKSVGDRAGESPTEDDLQIVERYAERSLSFLESYETALDILERREELSVTARLDNGRIVGDIDHLILTPDAFHVFDYKTNDTSTQTVEELSEYYRPQLEAYAIALHQSDPDRDVVTTLYYPEADAESTTRYSPGDLAELASELRIETL